RLLDEDQVVRRRRADRDGAAGPGEGAAGGVGGRDRLAGGGDELGEVREGVDAVVGRHERVGGGQHHTGTAVRRCVVDRGPVAAGHLPGLVEGLEREAERRAGRGGGRDGSEGEGLGRAIVDDLAQRTGGGAIEPGCPGVRGGDRVRVGAQGGGRVGRLLVGPQVDRVADLDA